MNLNTLLKIIFVILLFFLIGEAIYSIFYLPRQKPAVINNSRLPTITISTSPILSPQILDSTDQVFSENDLQSHINWLRKGKKDLVIGTTLTQTYQGKIVEIKLEEGINPLNKFNYAMILRIEGKEGNQKGFQYSKEDIINKLKIVKFDGKEKQPIKIEELKVGDKITVKETQDLFIKNCSKDECYQEFEITKL
jgi:hypothetical protein